jgi:mannose-6-phosphate isomerase-like protein (cupin superfamily)
MLGWSGDIEKATLDNEHFRTAVFTGEHLQLTVMRLRAGEDIGLEAHPDRDQFIRVEAGRARVELGRRKEHVDEARVLEPDHAVIVPAGVWHNVVNAGEDDLRLYSLYAPPEHPADTMHRTKAEADAAEHDH